MESAEDIIIRYASETGMAAVVWPITGWETEHIVRLIELLDAELQRRHADGS